MGMKGIMAASMSFVEEKRSEEGELLIKHGILVFGGSKYITEVNQQLFISLESLDHKMA